MESQKPSMLLTSFEDLKVLLEKGFLSLPKEYDSRNDRNRQQDSQSPEELFRKAMEGVRRISKDKRRVRRICRIERPWNYENKEDAEALRRLIDLVRHGKGFDISETPEYVEGTGYHVHPSVARRLHQGEYSIQAHIDLHGLRVDDAKEIFEGFLKWAVTNGKRGVLVIHGRGRSSPSEPVLKKKVIDWLTHGTWRKWVVAYSSARPCDGGAGATYILLRERPVSKRFKKMRIEVKKR